MGSTERKRKQSRFQATGSWMRPDLRLAIYLRDDFRCLACNVSLYHTRASWITLDHIVPKEAGGSNHPSNLMTSCKSCNCSRRSSPLATVVDRAGMGRIRRQVKLKITPFRILARGIIQGRTGP